jgi:two-component system response regulator (stage 0 sporulation protein F)
MARILVIEDYESLRGIYQTALSAAGHKVDLAGDGLDALEIVKDHEPDLILLDLLLPHMGGLEFLRTYDIAAHPDVKVVVFSNLISKNLLEETKALGVKYYLTKAKFSPEDMVEYVEKTLSGDSEAMNPPLS